ncbi:hypothetical protein HMPREF3036_01523 [Sutterella sp. KLE1602]|nr:hypothetical protein HMPREF3036_01523 [Sutterella sp. KLE1602]
MEFLSVKRISPGGGCGLTSSRARSMLVEQILYFKYLYCQEARVAFCKRMLRVRIVEFA